MDYRAFEQRLLDTIFTTDVQLTPATIAYLYKLSLQEASDLLQQSAVNGLLNIESDDEGNLLYVYPNRTRLPARDAAALSQRAAEQGGLRSGGNGVAAALVSGLGGTSGTSGGAVGVGSAPAAQAGSYESGGVDALPAELTRPGMVRCPFCNEQIIAGAKKCKHCHEYLDYALRDIHVRNQAHSTSVALQPTQQQAMVPWTGGAQAALLSVFMPGLGQMCNGRVAAGLLWMMFTIMGYVCLFVPGITLHILCVMNAYRQPRQLP